jgi:hypothetical protein
MHSYKENSNRDTIINFGDNLDEEIILEAERTSSKADVMMALGRFEK